MPAVYEHARNPVLAGGRSPVSGPGYRSHTPKSVGKITLTSSVHGKTPSILSNQIPYGQIQQDREDIGAHQGQDTLAALVRNSEGCEDNHQPGRDGCQCRNAELHVPKEIIV